ncbi:transposase IS200-like domain protein [Selenomonas sp. FOBRC9]|nr:transposase IS200-like domain protein [Selenomonas sp. FOBRC9]
MGEQFGKPTVGSLPTIVRSFKAIVTRGINELRGTNGAVLWQENYYERVIRQEEEYQNIVAYIRNNPVKWEEDELYIR